MNIKEIIIKNKINFASLSFRFVIIDYWKGVMKLFKSWIYVAQL